MTHGVTDPAPVTGPKRWRGRPAWASAGGPWRLGILFVLPYLILQLAWLGSNPPGSAPDESDHLVKALGMAHLDIGSKYLGPPVNASDVAQRNASISRVVSIPARLDPHGYACNAFEPNVSAACLPAAPPSARGSIKVVTALGSYPPFLYVPIGLVAGLASTPYHAFLLGRLVCAAMAGLLLLLGSVHLVRWLGRPALIGAAIGFTPMVVFTDSMVGLSGVEISGAFAVAAVAVAALRRPESLREPGTQLLFAGVGAGLILSRQLGVVTFGAIFVLLVLRLGWRYFWTLVREHRPAFLASVAVLVAAAAAIAAWERGYDHPSHTGSIFTAKAVHVFDVQNYSVLQSAVGNFGWLDTLLPRWCFVTYFILLIVLVGAAIMLGGAADRWTLVGWLVATVVLAYVTYATVFYPVQAGLQGRHVLPFFMLVPLLAGVVVAERFGELDPAALRRFVTVVAVFMPVLQFVGLYENARRYAVGLDGPIFFLRHSDWHPVLGWPPWLLIGAVGAALLVASVLSCRPELPVAAREFSAKEVPGVAR
jgi:hypothetical protein